MPVQKSDKIKLASAFIHDYSLAYLPNVQCGDIDPLHLWKLPKEIPFEMPFITYFIYAIFWLPKIFPKYVF